MPNIIVIDSANGAGKSTLAPFLLRDTFGIDEYLNADTIAEGLSAFAPENVLMSHMLLLKILIKTALCSPAHSERKF